MKKFTVLIILFFSLSFGLFSQQDPEFSQPWMALTSFNPGAAGSTDKVCLHALHREQWLGFDGAPSTSLFSADGAFSFFGANHGVGLSFMNDAYGFESNLGIKVDYAYRLDLGNGKLGLGINLGILNKAMKPEWNIPEGIDGLDDVQGDPSIPQNEESRVGFDMGLGVFYRSENIFFGISTTHLNQARIRYENAEPYLVRHYYATGGYRLQLANPLFEIMPMFVLKSDGKTNQFYLNTLVRYNKRFWGGVSYRASDAIVGIVGVEMFNGVKLTFSYDFVTSKISKYSSGSQEFSVGYCFDLGLDKSPQKYKSIRFL